MLFVRGKGEGVKSKNKSQYKMYINILFRCQKCNSGCNLLEEIQYLDVHTILWLFCYYIHSYERLVGWNSWNYSVPLKIKSHTFEGLIKVMVFNATINNSSVISRRSVAFVEETWVPWDNLRPVASHWQTLSHNAVSSTSRLGGIRTHTFEENVNLTK